MWPVRRFLGMKSRRQRTAIPETPVTLLRDGVGQEVSVAAIRAPLVLPFPVFAPPKVRTGDTSGGIAVQGVVAYLFGEDPYAAVREGGAGGFQITQDLPAVEFARLIAKIAHGVAFARKLLSTCDQSAPVKAILGTTEDIGQWVGTLPPPYKRCPGVLHVVRTALEGTALIVHVQLFASSGTPTYEVVLRP
jgi:hypothetical protein